MSNVTTVVFFRPPKRPTGGTVYVRPSDQYARVDEDLEPPPSEESAGSPSPNPR